LSNGLIEERKILVPSVDRVVLIAAERRQVMINAIETRRILIPHEEREVAIAGENRTIRIPSE
jgi:hypothetical protein